MDRRVGKVQVVSVGQPLLDFFVAAKPLRLGEPLFELLHYARGD